jgi:hypothetical protein
MPAPGTPLDLTPMLPPERTALLDLLRGLSTDEWQRATECPAWNVKGVALHILGDDLSLLTRQRDASTDSLTLFAESHPGLSFRALLDGFNEEWVTAAQFLSTDLLIELLRLVGEWSDTFYGAVGLDTISNEPVGLFAETEPSPYWQVIAREYVERFTHQSQIRRAVHARELDGDITAAAVEVVVHVCAAWLRDDDVAAGSTVVVDFGAPGTWTYIREPDQWRVVNGATADAAARISVAPSATVALISRGLPREIAVASVTVDGDKALARGVLQRVVPLLQRPTD